MKRDRYLNLPISKKHNGLIKVITSMRRRRKSYLLFNLFKDYLHSEGIEENHMIKIVFDTYENKQFCDPDVLYLYLKEQIKDDSMYDMLLDEVQLLGAFEAMRCICTHSALRNSCQFIPARSRMAGMSMCCTGGIPLVLSFTTSDQKIAFLKPLFEETYISDIVGRHNIRNKAELEELLNILSSTISSMTNPEKLSATFRSVKNKKISSTTIRKYIDYFCDSFQIDSAVRYDVKGKKYIDIPVKYCFTDMGLRNARLNFGQLEETHSMKTLSSMSEDPRLQGGCGRHHTV